MKHLQFIRTHFLLAVALLTAGITMSFSANNPDSDKADTIYTYNSADLSPGAFANTANWMVVPSAPGCVTSGNRPCNIAVPAGSTLASQISGLSNSQVLAIHPTQRKP